MMVETPMYRAWWTSIAGVMAGCLCLAVAGLPLYGGSRLALSLLGGFNAVAGFAATPWLDGMPDWRRRLISLTFPLGLALLGHALPLATVPIVWAALLGLLCWTAAGSIEADLARINRSTDGEVVASAVARLGGNFLAGLILLFLLSASGFIARPSRRPACTRWLV
jgi:hypothetical protein